LHAIPKVSCLPTVSSTSVSSLSPSSSKMLVEDALPREREEPVDEGAGHRRRDPDTRPVAMKGEEVGDLAALEVLDLDIFARRQLVRLGVRRADPGLGAQHLLR
jgi:hypothetical protein